MRKSVPNFPEISRSMASWQLYSSSAILVQICLRQYLSVVEKGLGCGVQCPEAAQWSMRNAVMERLRINFDRMWFFGLYLKHSTWAFLHSTSISMWPQESWIESTASCSAAELYSQSHRGGCWCVRNRIKECIQLICWRLAITEMVCSSSCKLFTPKEQ